MAYSCDKLPFFTAVGGFLQDVRSVFKVAALQKSRPDSDPSHVSESEGFRLDYFCNAMADMVPLLGSDSDLEKVRRMYTVQIFIHTGEDGTEQLQYVEILPS